MCWGLKGEALLPPLGNNIRRRKDARNEMRADSTGEKNKKRLAKSIDWTSTL